MMRDPIAIQQRIPSAQDAADEDFTASLQHLFNHDAWGNMGHYLYTNGGAKLFEKILTSSYTPYIGESILIQDNLGDISSWAGDIDTVIIIGPGPARSIQSKEIPVLKTLSNLKRVHVVDLSPEFNRQSLAALSQELPSTVSIKPFEADYAQLTSDAFEPYERALVISTGSLTNFENCPKDQFPSKQIREHLLRFKGFAKSGGKILWGYDSILDPGEYNTPEVSNFLMYPLEKAKKLPGVNLDASKFKHETRAYEAASLLAHEWVATEGQYVDINGERFLVDKDSRLMMFGSVKPDPSKLEGLVTPLGLDTAFIKREPGGAVLHGFNCK
jgi:hypothetical protein